MKNIRSFENFSLNETVSKSHNWSDGITQSKDVRKKIESLAKEVDAIFKSKKVPVRIELFDSGYTGFHVKWASKEAYVMDMPGKVGLEDQSMPYISLKSGGHEIKHGPDYHSRQFGSVHMEDSMRKDLYGKIKKWFEENI